MRSVAIYDKDRGRGWQLAEAIRDGGFRCRHVRDAHAWCTATPLGILILLFDRVPDFDIIRRIDCEHPGVSLLCLAESPTPRDVVSGIQAGAVSVIDSDTPAPQVVMAIEAIQVGKVLVDVALMRKVVRQSVFVQPVDLNAEELRLLQLIVDDAHITTIEQELCCSRRTAYRRIDDLVHRMGARSPEEATYLAGLWGLLTDLDDGRGRQEAHRA